MSDDGFEEFSDDGSDQDVRIDVGEALSTDFFGDDNRQYQETTTESPFEIPYSNMKDLGKRKPKPKIAEETINFPTRDNEVNIGMPERSPSLSGESEDEMQEDQQEGGISDLMKSFLKRGQDETKSPTNEPEAKFGVPDIAPPKKTKTVQEHYEEKMAKFKNSGAAMNGIMEEDEFGDEDPLVMLGLAEKKTKKKKKEHKDKPQNPEQTSTKKYSVGVDRPSGLTSTVQAQAAALQREKERLEVVHVKLSNQDPAMVNALKQIRQEDEFLTREQIERDRKRAEEAEALKKVIESTRPKNANPSRPSSKPKRQMIVKKFKPL